MLLVNVSQFSNDILVLRLYQGSTCLLYISIYKDLALQRRFNCTHIFHRKWERTGRSFILKMAFVTRQAIIENKIELCSSILYHPKIYFKAGPVDPVDSELAFYLSPVFFLERVYLILFFLSLKCG